MAEDLAAKVAIGARVKEARKLAGLSQAQLARLMEMHRPSISEVEAGRRRLSADELSRLSGLLDVSVEWLVEGQEKRTQQKLKLAARELGKLKPEELDKLLALLAKMRG